MEGVEITLDRIRRAPSILDVFALADALATEAAGAAQGTGAADRAGVVLLAALRDEADAPTAIAAAHALARLPGSDHDDRLAEILVDGAWLAPHVAWSLANRRPAESLVGPLVGLLEAGRLGGMLAQRTLVRWGADLPEPIRRTLVNRLPAARTHAGRARLVETLGLVGGAEALLRAIAVDRDEPIETRMAAIAALGDRPGRDRGALAWIATADDAAADAAHLALLDHRLRDAGAGGHSPDRLRIVQVHLGGRLDRTLAHAGEGDTGGIATLLVQLGDALAADPRIAAVTTIGRGSAGEAMASLAVAGGSSRRRRCAAGSARGRVVGGGVAGGCRRGAGPATHLPSPPADLLHLRMSDVGSLAAARFARRHGLPTVFTLAPDPHAVIADMERSGELDRATFGKADARDALWFRARLVGHLADSAAQVALFPRPELAARLRDLLGIDVSANPGRYHVIPEGIDPLPVRAARAEVSRAGTTRRPSPWPPPMRSGSLGPGRRGLPIVASVGRLADVKGMARIVEAFAADPGLRRRANLVIVGGDLAHPTPGSGPRSTGSRPPSLPAPSWPTRSCCWVTGRMTTCSASSPSPRTAWPRGSRRAARMSAPAARRNSGSPSWRRWRSGSRSSPRGSAARPSYVEDGVTGLLVDTLDLSALAAGMHGALDLAGLPEPGRRGRGASWRTGSRSGAMADGLTPLYAVGRSPGAAPSTSSSPAARWPRDASRHQPRLRLASPAAPRAGRPLGGGRGTMSSWRRARRWRSSSSGPASSGPPSSWAAAPTPVLRGPATSRRARTRTSLRSSQRPGPG